MTQASAPGPRLAFQVATMAALLLLGAGRATAQVTALQTDCAAGGKRSDGSYQFVSTCAGRAWSPDGRFAVVQRAYDDRQPPIELQDRHGRTLARLRALSDDMPFLLSWAPNARWFFVNHHVGSFMDELQVFEVVGRKAVERPAAVRAARRVAVSRYPCLRTAGVLPNAARWSRDGRRIALVTISRADACAGRTPRPDAWNPLWMIADVQTGRVVPDSIRPDPSDGDLHMPHDGPYADF